VIYTWAIVHVEEEVIDEPVEPVAPEMPFIIRKLNDIFGGAFKLVFEILVSVYNYVVRVINIF
ncbi:MAG: hypothetical protein IJS17_05870, partial [Clostridia bacterium]|nr:hypothetical protein [Clostridia bacterium]